METAGAFAPTITSATKRHKIQFPQLWCLKFKEFSLRPQRDLQIQTPPPFSGLEKIPDAHQEVAIVLEYEWSGIANHWKLKTPLDNELWRRSILQSRREVIFSRSASSDFH